MLRYLFLGAAFAFSTFLLCAGACQAQSISDVYDFSDYPAQWATLTQGRDGRLYGNLNSAMYRLSTDGSFEELYSYPMGTQGGVTLASDGYYYGTLLEGGTFGRGVLFRISQSGIYTDLHDFGGGSDGSAPMIPPIEGADGNLYGATPGDVAGGPWTVYKYTKSGDFTTIYSVSENQYFVSPLIQDTDGNLYGTTEVGAAHNCGEIFKLNTAGVLLLAYSFPCDSNGGYPVAPLTEADDGNFYGVTSYSQGGHGTIFKMTPGGTVSTIYNFLGGSDGAQPFAGLLQATDRYLYGSTTMGGGTGCGMTGCGTLFRISTTGAYAQVYAFDQSVGQFPSAAMTQHTNGLLYATTISGGKHSKGSVVSLNVGLAPSVLLLPATGKPGRTVQILGQKLTGTTSVKFNGVPSKSVTVISDTYIRAVVPGQASSGTVVVTTPTATIESNKPFHILR
jgi:uncharacterized repeat protein (TIGR03803 family)